MANLTGMPISSLPETTLQEGDQVIGYRADTGKAYRTDLANEVSSLRNEVAELKDSLTELNTSSAIEGFCSDYVETSRVTKFGNAKTLRLGTILLQEIPVRTQTEIGTIPNSNYFPKNPFQAYMIFSSSGAMGQIHINQSGLIRVTLYDSISVGNNFDLTLCYV